MKSISKLLGALCVLTLLTACGTPVEVPPANVGKILTKNGYAPSTIPPSKFRLEHCWVHCDRLVLLQASDAPLTENMVVFMPDDKLNLGVDIRGTMTIPTDEGTVNSLYDRLTAKPVDEALSVIPANLVYTTYGQQAVRGVVRSEIVKYSIAEILENRETIGQNIHAAIVAKLKETNTPILVSRFELANIQPPKVIVEAQQAAKEREIDIQKAEADAQVQMVVAERALEVAKMDRLVEREKAQAIAEQNKIAAESITPEVLAYKKLETAQNIYTALAKSNNVVIVPADSSSFSSITDDAVLAKLLGKEVRQ
jgi:hypothetical protein